MKNHSWSVLLLVVFLVASTGPRRVSGCPYSFRQAGFVEFDPAVYSVYFVVGDGTATKEALSQWVKEASAELLAESNVAAAAVNVDREPSHRAAAFCKSMGITAFPSVLIFRPGGEGMFLAGTPADGVSKNWVWSELQKVISSPAGEEIGRRIVSHWCVVLLVEGEDAGENDRVRSEIASAASRITGLVTETGLVVEEGPHLLTLPPDCAEDRILLWSLGLTGGKSGPQAAVLFGRGRRLGPVFEGPSLTASALYDVFYLLGRWCVCTIDRQWLSGRSIPLKWPATFRDEVMRGVRIDVSSPEVRFRIAPGMEWLSGRSVPTTEAGGPRPLGGTEMVAGPLGYTEITLGPDGGEAGLTSFAPHIALQSGRPAASAPPLLSHMGRVILCVALALGLAALVGSAAVLLKRRRQA